MSQHTFRRWLVAAATVTFAFGIFGAVAAPQDGSVSAAPSAEECSWTTADRQSTGHYHVASAADSVNNAIYYFGGVDQSGDASSFLGSLDVSDPDITKASMTSVRPGGLPELYGSAGFFRVDSMDADNSAAYFIGGSRDATEGEGEGEGSVYRYNPKTNNVDVLNAGGNLPDVLFGAVAYDPDGDQAVFYGGTGQCPATPSDPPNASHCRGGSAFGTRILKFDDTGGATWTPVSAGSGPGQVFGNSMVYDSKNKQMLLFGGTTDGSRANGDVWALSLAPNVGTWTRYISSGPRARFFHSAAFDAGRGWMIINGGVASGLQTNRENTLDDTWALEVKDNANRMWVNLNTSPLGAKVRVGAAMDYAAGANAAVLHAGRSQFQPSGNRPSGNTDGLVCAVLPDTPTPGPTNTPAPRPTSGPGGGDHTPWTPPAAEPASCPQIQGRVPDAVVQAALGNPPSEYMLCNPNAPIGPQNLYRDKLALQDGNKPYHPIFNRLQWKCGCQ